MTSKRPLPRRAWTALAWAFVWFVAGQLTIRAILQSKPEIADPEFGRKLVDLHAAIDRQPGRPLVLMFGSSRVATGFRPDCLPRHDVASESEPLCFNFAQVGSGPEMAHLSLKRLLDEGIRPDWILLEFWAPTFVTERGLREFMDQVNVGGLSWGDVRLLAPYVSRPRRLYRHWLSLQLAPLVSNREALVRYFAPRWVLTPSEPDRRCRDLDHLGWWSPKRTVDPEERTRLFEGYRQIYERRLRRFKVARGPDRALREIVSLCESERIKATLVVLPEGEGFRALYPAETVREMKDYLDRIGRECRVEVVDARDWVGDRGFMDGHHLLPLGASAFTRRLGEEVLHPRMAASPARLRR